MVVRPRDFDPAAKYRYPVIVDVYGGPEHQQVVASMRSYLLDQWIADHGFIVVAIDGRGTPGRGRDWERAIAGHFGSVPLDDQVEALKLLGAKYPEMDMERVGITGWSFGGYMSALAVLRRPDVFKAAVAGAPVSEWMDYDTCYTERYLGVPGEGCWPDAYKEGVSAHLRGRFEPSAASHSRHGGRQRLPASQPGADERVFPRGQEQRSFCR